MTWTKKDSNPKKIVSGFLNEAVVLGMRKLERKGIFDEVIGIENEGKESAIVKVVKEIEGKKEYRILKIHRIEANKFQKVNQYIIGDPRFSRIKPDRRSIVFHWAKKEFSNLKRAFEAKVSCPEPYAFLDNMVVMSIIQNEDGTIAPKMKDVNFDNEELKEKIFAHVLNDYKKLYQDAEIVHADLSEFNVLLKDGKYPHMIDFAQGVHIQHPKSDEFLARDMHNLCRYFNKIGIKKDENECISFIKN